MKQPKSRIGLILIKIYLFMVFTAFVFTIFALEKTAFAGVYLLILTLPWSVALTLYLDYLHMQDSIPIIMKLGISLVEAFVNAYILYWFGSMFEKTKID